MDLVEDIKARFRTGDALTRIILINIGVFLIIGLSNLVFTIGGIDKTPYYWLLHKIEFAEYLPKLLYQPWSIITHMFVHESFGHIFWNMIVFYWVGQLFIEYLGSKKLLSVYLIGGVFAIAFQSLIVNTVPIFKNIISPESYALGASGSINACLVAIATLIPDYTIFLILIGPVRLKYIAIAVVLLSLINLPNGNAGGEIAHIGGALFGFIYSRQLKQGNDWGLWLTKLIDRFSSKNTRAKMRVAHKRSISDVDYKEIKKYDEEQIDRILDKISKSGYNSLTKEEKEILFSASDKKN